MMSTLNSMKRQTGAALFTVLILLVALTLVSLTSLGGSLLELRMAANEEAEMSAFQRAQAGVDAVLSDATANFVVSGNVGHRNCYNRSGCEATIAALPEPVGSDNTIVIERLTETACPPRTRDSATSCANQGAVTFSLQSEFDATDSGQGKAEINQGYIQLVPAGQTSLSAAPATDTTN